MDPARGRRPDGDGPDDEFESIVAGWRSEGSVPDWPERAPEGPAAPPPATPSSPSPPSPSPPSPPPAAPPGPSGERPVHRPGPAADETDDDHYHPPEPPPLPRPGPPAVVGAGLILVGLVLCVAPSTIGAGGTWPLPLGLVLMASGLTWLVLRLWTTERDDEGPDPFDDGSRL